jgi:urease accessory protein
VVTRAFAASPLRLLTPSNHGHAAWVYTSSFGGGLVDGDHVNLDVDVGPGATALLSTQASTKVYRSPRGTASDLRARVAAGGLLVVAPDPVVCFAGARYRQTQHVEVAEGGAVILVDCLLSGRCASGERWDFSEYRTLTRVTAGNRLIVHDAVALRADDGDLRGRFRRFDAIATVVVAGDPLRDEAERLVAISSALGVTREADQLMCASPLGTDGCLLRIAGTQGHEVVGALRHWLRAVPARLGDDPWRRKW